MILSEFRKAYPEYNAVGDDEIIRLVNAKYPGRIVKTKETVLTAAKGEGEYVERYDPKRLLPQYAYRRGLAPSDIKKYGAEKFYKTQMEESDARDRVTLAFSRNKAVVGFRKMYPQYDTLDDVSFMEAVVKHHPEHTVTLNSVKDEQQKAYQEIDLLEYKQSVGLELTPREAFLNAFVVPEDNHRLLQQFALGYGNMVSFGLQNYILSRMGFDQTRPETGMEAVFAGVGSLAGFVSSPIKAATAVVKSIPGLNAIFIPINAASRTQRILKPLLRSGVTLGTANALLIPQQTSQDQGLLQPGNRIREFGGGFMFGTGLGGLSFIPNRAARMITSSLFFGLPSTLREDTLEEQVFNYGYGAYAGLRGSRELIKREDLLRKTIEKGVTDPKDVATLLKRSDDLLSTFRKLAEVEGQPYTNIIDSGRNYYVPVYKGWRRETIKWIKVRLPQIRKEAGFHLRNDKISQLFEQLRGVNIEKLSDAQLFNIQEHIRPANTPKPPTTPFMARPPARPEDKGSPKAKHLSLFHHLVRLGYEQLEHMGFGEMFEHGLTGNVVRSDVKATQMLKLHREMTNVWKQLVGIKGDTARRLFLSADGKCNLKQLSINHPQYATQYKVSKQVRQYLDVWLSIQNRHLAKYGEKPVKPLDKYITHIFDSARKRALTDKYPFPDYLADIMEFVPPKDAKQPFLRARRGRVKGYRENIWAALDAYAFEGSDFITDDGLRQTNRVIKFLGNEIRINEKTGKQSPIDLRGIKNNLTDWANRYAGRPGKIDDFIRRATLRLPDSIRQHVNSMESLSGLWRTLIYTGYMGWRPKLALRNLGQHSLIIGEVGPANLWKAIRERNVPEARKLLEDSLVLQSRELGFAPEMPYTLLRGGIEELRRSAFYMFRTADRVNVEDAFLAGYFEVTRGKYAKAGSDMHKRAMKRGDTVAAHTQYMYTKGNRGPISNLWGLSTDVGRFASMFTTWPINKMELMMSWSKPGQRIKLARYLGVVALGGLASVASSGKFKSTAYTGWGAEMRLWEMVREGLVGIDNLPLTPHLMVGNDVKQAMEDKDLWRLILYDVNKNTPLWEKF